MHLRILLRRPDPFVGPHVVDLAVEHVRPLEDRHHLGHERGVSRPDGMFVERHGGRPTQYPSRNERQLSALEPLRGVGGMQEERLVENGVPVVERVE